MTMEHRPAPEFSRVILLPELGDGETEWEISADADERARLARRFDLVALDALDATVRLQPLRAGRAVRFSAKLRAAVTQSCVATLEPVSERIEGSFRIVFDRDDEAFAEGVELDLDAEEDREPLTGDSLDIGEIVAQELALSLNPYPRAPDAEAVAGEAPSEGDARAPKPFESLAVLKRSD